MANSDQGTFISGEATVDAAGTAQVISTTVTSVIAISIIAKAGNTGQVYVGGSDVASTTNDGLDAGEVLNIDLSTTKPGGARMIDLDDIYIDADTTGEGIDFYAIKVRSS